MHAIFLLAHTTYTLGLVNMQKLVLWYLERSSAGSWPLTVFDAVNGRWAVTASSVERAKGAGFGEAGRVFVHQLDFGPRTGEMHVWLKRDLVLTSAQRRFHSASTFIWNICAILIVHPLDPACWMDTESCLLAFYGNWIPDLVKGRRPQVGVVAVVVLFIPNGFSQVMVLVKPSAKLKFSVLS